MEIAGVVDESKISRELFSVCSLPPAQRTGCTLRIRDSINDQQELLRSPYLLLILKDLPLSAPIVIQHFQGRFVGIFEAVILRETQSLSEQKSCCNRRYRRRKPI